jgi:membrane-bound lytic murein transglycosylase MltF
LSHKAGGYLRVYSIFLIAAVLAGCTATPDEAFRKPENQVDLSEDAAPLAVAPTGEVISDAPGVDAPTMRIVRRHGEDIKRYARMYGLDWRFVLAVMKQESRFSHRAESPVGARGLMQIMPETGEEVSRVLAIDNVHGPLENIRGGAYYLGWLYGRFERADQPDRLRLTLAAYNAGINRVGDAQAIASYLRADPTTWRGVRDALPLLSKRYGSLHDNIWHQDRPKSGWFRNPRQTIAYVDNVMGYYEEFRLLFN